MNKQETIKRLREWGNGDFSKLQCKHTGLCYNIRHTSHNFLGCLYLYLRVTYGRNCVYPLGAWNGFSKTERLWKNPKRLQLCLDFADWLEEGE